MKSAVIFRSKSGYTRRYAQWLADALDATPIPADSVTLEELSPYDLLIYGGGLYASGINGLKAFLKLVEALPDKRLIIFAVGVTPSREDVVPQLIQHNLPAGRQSSTPLFYLRGGFDANTLTFSDRILMGLLKLKLKFKTDKTPDERGMLAAYKEAVDFTRNENLASIVTCAKSFEPPKPLN